MILHKFFKNLIYFFISSIIIIIIISFSNLNTYGSTINVGFTQQMYLRPSLLNYASFLDTIDQIATSGFANPWIRVPLDDIDVFPRTNLTTDLISCDYTTPINCNPANLDQYQTALSYAKSRGVSVILITNTPSWAKLFSNPTNPWETKYTQNQYITITQSYYTIVSNKLASFVDTWQLFNEPNIHAFDSYVYNTNLVNNKTYMANLDKVLTVSINKIKSLYPLEKLLVNVGGYPFNQTLVNSWSKYINSLNLPVNEYGLDIYPDTDVNAINLISTTITSFKNTYNLPISVTETGMCTDITRFSETDQANYVSQYINQARIAGASGIFVYELKNNPELSTTCEQNFGIVKVDGTRKLGYDQIINSLR